MKSKLLKTAAGEEYAVFLGGDDQSEGGPVISTGITGTLEQIFSRTDHLYSRLSELEESGEEFNEDNLVEDDQLTAYMRDFPLIAFPVEGGPLLQIYRGEATPAGYEEITAAQGVRFQMKNLHKLQEFEYEDIANSATRKEKSVVTGK